MKEEHSKDVHRYSYSRLDTFKTCPMKHHYLYVEQIPELQSEYAIKGSLFHQCVEAVLKGEDPAHLYKEWKDYVNGGVIHAELDQLEYSVNEYFTHYYNDYSNEETLLVEKEYQFQLDEEDYFVEKVDQVYRINGVTIIRDIKSTSSELKYTPDMVKTNMQLLTYVLEVEKDLDTKVDAIEIDEVRLAKLADSVPLVKNGKPSTSLDVLNLVTADLYREELETQNLMEDQKYKNVLYLLEQRGHPLFRRVRIQLSNRALLETNLSELNSLYVGASIDLQYRIPEPSKCWMCPFKQICIHDQFSVDQSLRDKLIQNLYR